MTCCVVSCISNTINLESLVTFHRFPSEPHLRAAWAKALATNESFLPDNAVVCSEHFLTGDLWETDIGVKEVQPGAVPTLIQACVICLDTESKLYSLRKYNLGEAYHNLNGMMFDEENVPQALCAECTQRLMNFKKLREKSLRSFSLIMELVTVHKLVTTENIKTIDRNENHLVSTMVQKILEPNHCHSYMVEYTDDEKPKMGEIVHDIVDILVIDEENKDYIFTVEDYVDSKDETSENGDEDTAYNAELLCIKKEDTINNNDSDTNTWSHEDNDGLSGFCFEQEVKIEEEQASDTECYKLEFIEDNDLESLVKLENADIASAEDFVSKDSTQIHDTPLFTKSEIKIKKEKSNKKTISCEQCQCQFTRKHFLAAHIKIHANERHFLCKICHHGFAQKCLLNLHMKTHSGEKPFICDICNKSYARRELLGEHLKTHRDKPFSCDQCNYKCIKLGELVTHKRTHTGERPYACEQCDKRFARSDTLKLHVTTHTSDKPHCCDFCFKQFRNKSALSKHTHTHCKPPRDCALCSRTRRPRRAPDKRALVCTHCGHQFSGIQGLKAHMKVHSGERPFTCDHCDKSFTRKSVLTEHLYTHSGEKPFSCDICNRSFPMKNRLIRHIKNHSKEKFLECIVCDYKSVWKTDMSRHMKMHAGIKSYSCDICDHKFVRKSNLTEHRRVHTGEKPYICSVCDFKCAYSGTLRSHMRTHTGEKNYACSYCPKRYSRKSELDIHTRSHTGEKPFTCEICNCSFVLNARLKYHMKSHADINTKVKRRRT